jgi:uncharacterized protein YndB with AHSA1/START domain
MRDIDIRRTINAAPDAVYGLLDDSSSWPTWTPIDSFEFVERPEPDGLGEVRAFRTGRVRVVERIVERVPSRRLSYVLLAGLAVRDYRADIDLSPEGAGTTVRWHTTFKAKVSGMGWAHRRTLFEATQEFVDGLAERAAEATSARQDISSSGAST